MVLLVKLMFVSFVCAEETLYTIQEPPLCGKSIITNSRRSKRFQDAKNRNASTGKFHYGGKRSNSAEHDLDFLPYVASVQRFDVNLNDDVDIFDKRLSGAFVGTILGPTIVLVACRCVARHMGRVDDDEHSVWIPRQFGVMAGTPWDFSPVDGIVGQIRFASRIVVHPKCELRPSLYLWDLAVMVLKEPFKFIKDTVEPAPIPKTFEELEDYLALSASQRLSYFTVSWGWTFNSYKPKHLEQKLNPLFVQDFKHCDQPTAVNSVAHMLVCVETAASYLRLQRTGDVGSPLLGLTSVNESTDKLQYVVLGIKSIEDDATPKGFSLYTRLDIALDWISNISRHPPSAPMSIAAFPHFSFILQLNVILSIVWNQIPRILGTY